MLSLRLAGGLLSYSMLLMAQFDSAAVLGTVKDVSGARVPEVQVTLLNVDTGVSVQTKSDANGDYQFPNARIGNYEITAELTGFAKAVVENVVLTVNARQRVDLTLQVGAVTDKVVVTGAVELLETDSSEKGQVIDADQIENLPLNGRAYSDLALLAPGVSESNQNGIGSTAREGSFNVNGLRNTANNFQLDGVDNNAYGTSNQSFSSQVVQVSPDAIAEFKVQTNTYSAEYGRSGGAVINAAYRSGTNNLHGSLWEYGRNTAVNAQGFFQPTGGVKPGLIRNQFGFTLGGRIRRDRTFYFADYEGFRQVQKTLVYSTIPTLSHRDGILTVPVLDPFTNATYNAGTRVPMTAFARQVLSELPEPNVPGATSNNYQKAVPNRANLDKFNLRLDHKLNDRISTFARLSHSKNNVKEAPNIAGPSGGAQNGVIHSIAEQLAIGVTDVASANSIIEFRLGISRTLAGKHPPYIGGPSMSEYYGITGLPEDRALTGGLTPQSITGYSAMGRQATNPQFQNPFVINPRITYTYNRGRQSVKVGAEYARLNTEVQDTNPLYGLDSYNSQFSRPAGRAASNQYNLADFMLGLRTQYELATLMVAQMRQRSYYSYVQYDVKLLPRLTLNIGVRYEFVTPYFEDSNRLSNFNPETRKIEQASGGSLYERSLVNPDRNNFAPRFGYAYRLTRTTVLRGGYGIGYVYFNRLGSANLLATNYPQVTRSTMTQSTTETVDGVTRLLPLRSGNQYSGCFRTTQAGYPAALPNKRNAVCAAQHAQRLHPELAVRRGLCGEPFVEAGAIG
ncbi:MAG: TonB-dependent receptor [Acidobacteria bacterium]|nr:TonB-dependent receptor [Acidobacteriota bacterium]